MDDAFIRLERGGAEFLRNATDAVRGLGSSRIYSPALYPGSTGVWVRSGYEEIYRLGVMERSLSRGDDGPTTPVAESKPDWPRIVEIDRAAFSGFWRMNVAGLREAMGSTRNAAVLTSSRDSVVIGYAIVGAQWGVSYLQRVGVHPEFSGQNIGSDLVRAALGWGRKASSQVMVLNVRADNEPARRLYAKQGFTDTGTALRILCHSSDPAKVLD